MSVFNTSLEKWYWACALLVVAAIFSSLFYGRPLQEAIFDQQTQAVLFLAGLLLCGVAIVLYGLYFRIGRIELFVWLGLIAVYVMLIFRLGAPERSHLIEYSILSVFIHRALLERGHSKTREWASFLWAFVLTSVVGVLDECMQLFLPQRVFDPEDMVFNTLAALLALGSSMSIRLVRKRLNRSSEKSEM